MPRTIQDEEIRDMIQDIEKSAGGIVVKSNLIAMLEELLKLRERVRRYA